MYEGELLSQPRVQRARPRRAAITIKNKNSELLDGGSSEEEMSPSKSQTQRVDTSCDTRRLKERRWQDEDQAKLRRRLRSWGRQEESCRRSTGAEVVNWLTDEGQAGRQGTSKWAVAKLTNLDCWQASTVGSAGNLNLINRSMYLVCRAKPEILCSH